jgi:GTPase SAR1 family protein
MPTQLEKVSNNIVNAKKQLKEQIIPKATPFLRGRDLKRLAKYGKKFEKLAIQSKKPPTFSIRFLGDSQNGKSTLINVLIGKKVLPEGTVGHCSTTIVRCRYKDQDNISVTLKYVDENKFYEELEKKTDDAMQALEEDDDSGNQKENVTRLLGMFINLFDINRAELNTDDIIKHCLENADDFPERTLLGMTKTLDSEPANKEEIAENLSARGRKSFIVDECWIEGRFPDWHPSMELVDMPGTNALDPWDAQVTSRMQTEIDGLVFVTSGTELTKSVIDWFKETSILNEIVGSQVRNQTRVFIIKTFVDQLNLQIPNWEATENRCSDIREHLITQVNELINDRFTNSGNELDVLKRFVEQLPIHFVSSKIFRNLANPSLKNRVLNDPLHPNNLQLYSAFQYFDTNEENTGIPGLQQNFFDKTEEFVHSHYLKKLELDFQKEAGLVVRFFRDKRVGIEQGMVQTSEAIHQATQFINENLQKEIKETRELLEEEITGLKDNFEQEIESLLDVIVQNYGQQTRNQLNEWKQQLHWASLRCCGRKNGQHTTTRGYEIDFNGTLADFCVKSLNSTWIDYRANIKELSFDELHIRFLPKLEIIFAQAKGIEDHNKIYLIENTYGHAVSEAQHELEIQIEQYLMETEQFDAIRPALMQSIRKSLVPTYRNIAAECGTGCSVRMRNHLQDGVLDNIQAIRSIVRNQVRHNWQGLTNSVEERLDEFFNLIENNFSEQRESLLEAAQTPPDQQVRLLKHFQEMENIAEELVPQKKG